MNDFSDGVKPERYVLIDCDPGVDDCLGIMIALSQAPKVKTVGITCVNGNVGIKQVTINAMRVVKLFGVIDQVPVYKGCSEPVISMPKTIDSTFYHGKDGFGDVPHIEPQAEDELLKLIQEEHAVNAIIRLSKEYENKLQILAIGPMTNLALAVRLDPDLPKRLLGLHIMGGTIRGYGNVTPSAEYNFFTDPEAANMALLSYSRHCPVQLVTYEVTTDHAVPADWHEKWLAQDYNPKRLFFREIYQKSGDLELKSILEEMAGGYVICDAYLVCVALNPGLVKKSKQIKVGVELGGNLARGSLVLDHKNKGSPHLTTNTIELVEMIEMDQYQEMLLHAFS